MGRVGAAYGVKGWLKLQSYTSPAQGLFDYQPWLLRRPAVGPASSLEDLETLGQKHALVEGRVHGNILVAKLAGMNDRTAALHLTGYEILIRRSQLPALPAGVYYWADLIGLQVKNLQGRDLGRVTELLETGANDVLVVSGDGERLIPYVKDHYVICVDLSAGVMTVDWPDDY